MQNMSPVPLESTAASPGATATLSEAVTTRLSFRGVRFPFAILKLVLTGCHHTVNAYDQE